VRILIAAAFVLAAAGQQSQTVALVVRVAPEAHVRPAQVSFNFLVSADGSRDITSQTVTVESWVRATPGRPIRVTATQTGSLPLTWSGVVSGATAGGRGASCTSGGLTPGSAQDLTANWLNSGTLNCTVTFSLADPHSLAPGNYRTTVTFRAQ
jgi:hypothetical protein